MFAANSESAIDAIEVYELLPKTQSTRDAKTLKNVTLILILEFQEFLRITLKRFLVIYCSHSHSQTSRIFENFLRILGNSRS